MYGYTAMLFLRFCQKGRNFCDFLYASLVNVHLQKKVESIEKLGKNEKEGVTTHCSTTVCIPYKPLTLLHSERPKLYRVLAVVSAIGLKRAVAQTFH